MPPPPDRSAQQRRAAAKRLVAPSILIRVRIYLVVFVMVSIAAIVDAVRGTSATWIFQVAGVLVGVLIGVAASRMQRFTWDEFENRAVGKFDAVGVVVLVLYVIFSVFRSRIVGVWVPAVEVSATSVAVLAGVMFGQVLGIRRGLLQLLRSVLPDQRPS